MGSTPVPVNKTKTDLIRSALNVLDTRVGHFEDFVMLVKGTSSAEENVETKYELSLEATLNNLPAELESYAKRLDNVMDALNLALINPNPETVGR